LDAQRYVQELMERSSAGGREDSPMRVKMNKSQEEIDANMYVSDLIDKHSVRIDEIFNNNIL
jgi:hypothetical protein